MSLQSFDPCSKKHTVTLQCPIFSGTRFAVVGCGWSVLVDVRRCRSLFVGAVASVRALVVRAVLLAASAVRFASGAVGSAVPDLLAWSQWPNLCWLDGFVLDCSICFAFIVLSV